MARTSVPLVRAISHVGLDQWAHRVLLRHFPTVLQDPQPFPVERFLDVVLVGEYGIDVALEDLPPPIEGVCEPPDRLTISVGTHDGIVRGDPHDVFTGAHEAVHALLHIGQITARFESHGPGSVKVYRRDDVPPMHDPEWQANRGAAALLMPAKPLWEVFKRQGARPEAVRDAFGVSITAARFRVNDALSSRVWRPPGPKI